MTAADKTTPSQSDTVSFEFELRHAPDKVWRALTEPALLSEWLLPVIEGKLERGAAFKLQTQPYPPWDGTVNCRVIEIEPQTKLSYAWVVGAMDLDTVVTFTLTPSGAGTRLSLTQSGFKPTQKQAFGGARYGWNMMGQKLADVLERLS